MLFWDIKHFLLVFNTLGLLQKQSPCKLRKNVLCYVQTLTIHCFRRFVTPWTAARQASLSITNFRSLLKLMSTESVMPSSHLILCCPLSYHLQSFPASGSFPVSQFFTSGGKRIGVSASASVLPMNIQDWFLLGWTGWISLLSKGLSRVFSNTTVQKHQFSVLSFQLSHPYMTTGKTITLTRQTFVGKVMSLLCNMLSRVTFKHLHVSTVYNLRKSVY